MKGKYPGEVLCHYLLKGDVLYHATNVNADGTPQRWRVVSKVKGGDCPYVSIRYGPSNRATERLCLYHELPREPDYNQFDWRGWSTTLKRRQKMALGEERRTKREWERLRSMFEIHPLYWIKAWHRDGRCIILHWDDDTHYRYVVIDNRGHYDRKTFDKWQGTNPNSDRVPRNPYFEMEKWAIDNGFNLANNLRRKVLFT